MPQSSSAIVESSSAGVLSLVSRLPRKYPRLTTTTLLWILGLYCAFLAKPPAITEAQNKQYKAKLQEVEFVLVDLTVAERRLLDAQLEQYQFKVWFWRWRPEARQEVEARQPAVDAAQSDVDFFRKKKDQLLREAKGSLGIWSEAGVDEGRQLFWLSFASGKLFAQRQSFLDAVFTILGSRDRDWLTLLITLLVQTLCNFFTGLTASVFVFLFQLPSLVWSYQPALWSGLAFFSLAAVAAISVVASYLGLLLGAGAAVVYGTFTLTVQHYQRLEGQRSMRQQLEYERRRYPDEHHQD